MMKNMIMYIFIYIILIGCEGGNPVGGCESNCYLEITAPSLTIDEDGIYHMEWLEGYNQTFTTLDAETGSMSPTKVHWDTDLGMWWEGEVVKPINHSSYTNEDSGIAHTVLGPWEVMVENIITVYATYTDYCGVEYLDSIKVFIEDEI